jgi:hypothetical protein
MSTESYDASLVRWGIIGCGDVTEKKSGPALYTVPGSRLVAVMRRDAARAADYARRHGASRAAVRPSDGGDEGPGHQRAREGCRGDEDRCDL